MTDSTITLRSRRKGSGNDPAAAGNDIGRARIYTFENTDASYEILQLNLIYICLIFRIWYTS